MEVRGTITVRFFRDENVGATKLLKEGLEVVTVKLGPSLGFNVRIGKCEVLCLHSKACLDRSVNNSILRHEKYPRNIRCAIDFWRSLYTRENPPWYHG